MTGKRSLSNIAILTTQNEYVEFEFQTFKKNAVTFWNAIRIRNIFSHYQLTANSNVLFNIDYPERAPLYLYMTLLHQHIPFNLKNVTEEQILRRIAATNNSILKKKASDITVRMLPKVWNYMLRSKKCSWITSEYDNYLQSLLPAKRRAKKILSLGIYYMIAREYKILMNHISDEKRKKRESQHVFESKRVDKEISDFQDAMSLAWHSVTNDSI